MTHKQSLAPRDSASAVVSPPDNDPAEQGPQGPPGRREPGRIRAGARSSTAPAVAAGAAAVALAEAAGWVIRRDGATWFPRAMPASGWATGYVLPAAALIIAVAAFLAAVAGWRAFKRAVARHGSADVATYSAALMASAVSSQGMWVFFGTYMSMAVPLRCLVFAFVDVGILALALRGRDNMREFGAAGVDGLLMWLLTGGSAVLASTAATSAPEILARLVIPLGAALLWERALVSERRRRPEHEERDPWWKTALIRLHLADPLERTAGDAEQDHLIAVLAEAIHDYNVARIRKENGLRVRRAERRMDSAMRRVMRRTSLRSSTRLQEELSTQVRMLGSTRELARLEQESPWQWLPSAPSGEDHDGRGPGEIEELIGDLTTAQRDGDHARIRGLLDGRDDVAALTRCAVATGAPKRVLAAIALHAGQEQFASNAAASRWIASASGQDDYLPDVREISRTRKALFPELSTTGGQAAASLEPVAA